MAFAAREKCSNCTCLHSSSCTAPHAPASAHVIVSVSCKIHRWNEQDGGIHVVFTILIAVSMHMCDCSQPPSRYGLQTIGHLRSEKQYSHPLHRVQTWDGTHGCVWSAVLLPTPVQLDVIHSPARQHCSVLLVSTTRPVPAPRNLERTSAIVAGLVARAQVKAQQHPFFVHLCSMRGRV